MNSIKDTKKTDSSSAHNSEAHAVHSGGKQMNEQFDTMTKKITEAGSFHKDNIKALASYNSENLKSAEAISTEIFAFSKKYIDEVTKVLKGFTVVKTLPELVEKNNELAKHFFELHSTQAQKITELAINGSKKALEPVSGRMNAYYDAAKTDRS